MTDRGWLTDEEFARLARLVAAASGLHLDDARRPFFAAQLARRLAATGSSRDPAGVAAYRERLERRRDPAEMLALLDGLAVTETAFFRHPPQWELFAGRILPELMASAERSGSRRLRLWSAGCSTGAEPYTMAIVLAETLAARGAALSGWDVRIRASDLSRTALAAAAAGVYPHDRLADLAPERRARFFVREGNDYRVREELRRWVEFRVANLLDPDVPSGTTPPFDAIFCRNVLIYFAEPERASVLSSLATALRVGGYLLLGHAESLIGAANGFRFVHEAGGTAYRKEAAQ